jgi:hypothetical protein
VATPAPLHIFHITAISNLVSIAGSKKLYAKAQLQRKAIESGNIAYQGAQGKRAVKMVAKPPGGIVHDYVPFYFAPRSPMLFTINNGNVPGCPHRQPDIVHIVTTVEAVVDGDLPYVFYDYNATLDIATCYSNVRYLDRINWPLFFESPRLDGYCKYWNSRMDNPKYVLRQETRQAEFLIHKSIPLKLMTMVGAYDQARAAEVREILEDADIDLPVEAKPAWYF